MNAFSRSAVVVLALLSGAAAGTVAHAQSVQESVGAAIRRGDATTISRHFGDPVDITLNRAKNSYSRTQAEMVLRDWFGKNNVTTYDVEHSGFSAGNTVNYSIGRLGTATAKYRVYLMFKKKDDEFLLEELRFEKL